MPLEIAVSQWMQMAARVRGELDRADFTSRQRRLIQFLFWATLMKQRLSVRVPRLRVLEDVLGMNKAHLSLNLRQLVKMRVLQIKPLAEGGAEYVLLPDSTNWDVPWLYDRARFLGLMRDLDTCTNQVQEELLPPEPSLLAALAVISAEGAYRNAVRPVPESGTPVPESGTGGVGGALNVQRLTASKEDFKEQLNSERLNCTEFPNRERPKAARESNLMKRVARFVGEEDMKQWGGDWRKNWVRVRPLALEKALNILEDDMKHGWTATTSNAAALKDLAKRLPE